MKMAWVQWFLTAIFWYILLYRGFFGYLVKKRVFESIEVCDINMRNLPVLDK